MTGAARDLMRSAEIKEIVPPKLREPEDPDERVHDLDTLTLDPINTAGDD